MKRLLTLFLLAFALAACGGRALATQNPNSFGAPDPNRISPSTDNAASASGNSTRRTQVILVPSEIVVGLNRFAVGIIDSQRGMLQDATVHLRYFDTSDPARPAVESEADATRLQSPDGDSTIYAQEREFQRAGPWGVEVQAKLADGTQIVKRIAFQVVEGSGALKPGDKVPSLETRTSQDVNGDLHQLTSAPNPNPEFYRQTLAQALESGKPTVMLFSTPAFCQTRLCGPAYEVVSDLEEHYHGQANFISIEVYRGLPNPAQANWELDSAMKAFGLQTEPWVFLIQNGLVVYRVEGVFTEGELEQHLRPLVGQGISQGK